MRLLVGAGALLLGGGCRDGGPTAVRAILCTRFVLDTTWIVTDSVPGYEVLRRCVPPVERP